MHQVLTIPQTNLMVIRTWILAKDQNPIGDHKWC